MVRMIPLPRATLLVAVFKKGGLLWLIAVVVGRLVAVVVVRRHFVVAA